MSEEEKMIKSAFDTLKQEGSATECQKENMLNYILLHNTKKSPLAEKIEKIFFICPWRIAFTVSAIQGIIFTILFGTRYTNIFLSYFGG